MPVGKVIEISAQSKKSLEDAIEQGVARASDTVENIEGAWIKEQKVDVEKGKVVGYRVIMKVTFLLK
ncbi:MAG: dodecin domain-containing protein [Candidatus Latescibacteria bacterium]|nr:dodecin domain-containing protein [Candidatus Latescibacterota bacterium]